ncbi:hypothetical protein ABEX47_22065 [Paenibacillus ehimensis]|uniref:hypothetical protein n=1 Tax=Paenibacillus ehimensis TaxID=79264 RepID=UPI003D27EAE1
MKSFRSFITLALILGVFIAGFHLLSSLSFRGKASYLTTLDKELFQRPSSNHGENPFAVSRIVKFTIPFNLLESDLLNMNSLAFTSSSREVKHSVQTGIYDMSKNQLTHEFDQQNGVKDSKISVSADGKMILVSYMGMEDRPGATYVYEATTNSKRYTFNGTFAATWLPDSLRFVGMDDYLFVQNIKTGQRENLLNLTEYAGKHPKTSLSFYVLNDGQTVCLYSDVGNANLLLVDLETGKQWSSTLKGQIFNLVPIDNTNTAAVGLFEDQLGIFLYDAATNSLEPFIDLNNQKLIHISVSQDGKKLAYSILKNNVGGYGVEVHAVHLNNKKIISHEVIYKESNQFIDKLLWSKDSQMLYCFQQNTDGTTLYRITFNPS